MVPAEQVHCHVKEEEDDLEVDHEGDAKTGYYFCKNGPVSGYHLTEEEREEISSVRIPAQPTNPVFGQVMPPGHVRGKKSGLVVSDLPSGNQLLFFFWSKETNFFLQHQFLPIRNIVTPLQNVKKKSLFRFS